MMAVTGSRMRPAYRRRPRRRSRWRESGFYLVLAFVLGWFAPELGEVAFPDAVARMSASSAVALLAAIASGMMAMTGLALSLIFVFVQLGTSAYSPRLVAELGRRRLPAHSVGIFAGTFLYSALAIRAVEMQGSQGLNLTVGWIALFWLLASVTALMFLMGAMGQMSIGRLLANLGSRGLAEASRIHPVDTPESLVEEQAAARRQPVTQAIEYRGPPMHVLGLDEAALVRAARSAEGVVVLPYGIGEVICAGDVLAEVRGSVHPMSESCIRRAIILGTDRIVENEPAYALRLMVDIAIRALSPAVNDPTTAVMALDQIEPLLRALGRSRLDIGCVVDDGGAIRLLYESSTWDDLLLLALSEIQDYGRESIQVRRRLAALLSDLIQRIPEQRRDAVQRMQKRGEETLQGSFPTPEQRSVASARDRQGLGRAVR